MELSNLRKITDKKKKRVGRGYGSGKGGHTVGRGSKGQKSRAGSRIAPLFEGGQNPLSMRIPHKKGFIKHTKVPNEIIRIDSLNIFNNGDEISAVELFKTGIIKGEGTPKILDTGELTVVLKISGILCSKGAKEKIEKLGGSVIWS